MNWPVYVKLSAMFFMEFAVWGAWAPVLAARLLGPLKMTGKQTGWIYATLPLASFVAPLVAGQLADRYIDVGWILVATHFVGAGLLLLAAKAQKFSHLFVTMLLYSMCYGASLPMANVVIFRHIGDNHISAPDVFIWAPVAWALVGYALTGWRRMQKTEGDGSDCLKFAALLSAVMAAVCLFLPATPPQPGAEAPLLKAVSMLHSTSFLVFMAVSLIAFAMMQFYFLCTAPFMQDSGIAGKNVPAAMAVAQAVQAAATLFLLNKFYNVWLGPAWTLTVGAGCWAVLYLVYVSTRSGGVIVASQAMHGLAYVLFVNGAWMFTDAAANTLDPAIAGSAQALYALVTNGIGLFVGTQLAGFAMDRSSVNGKFQWRKVFMVPLACTLAGVIAMAVAVHNPDAKEKNAPPPPTAAAAPSATAGG